MSPIERGELARVLLENPIFDKAINEMRQAFITSWEQSAEGEEEKRQLAWRHVKFLGIFEGVLREYVRYAIDIATDREELP